MRAILRMASKLTTSGLFKTNVFRNKDSDVIASVHDVTDKILSRDSNYVVDVIILLNFGNASISGFD